MKRHKSGISQYRWDRLIGHVRKAQDRGYRLTDEHLIFLIGDEELFLYGVDCCPIVWSFSDGIIVEDRKNIYEEKDSDWWSSLTPQTRLRVCRCLLEEVQSWLQNTQ